MTLLLLIIGCDEDPITPPPASNYEFDTARFNWSVDTLPGWGYGTFSIFSPDTSDFFAVNSVGDFMVRIKDGIKSQYFFSNFNPNYLGGMNSNELYVGGGKIDGNIYLPHLKKWNGGSFEDINIQSVDSTNGGIIAGIVNSSSDMWFATNRKMIRYESGIFSHYNVTDSNRIPEGFFLNNNSNPTLISNTLNEQIDTIFRNYIYEWNNGSVIQTYMNTWYPGNPNYTWMQVANNEIYGMNDKMIYKFHHPNFIPYIPVPDHLFYTSGAMVAGNSLQDFVVMMYDYTLSINGNLENLHHWNGTRFSNEEVGINILSGGRVSMHRMNDDYFICMYQDIFKSGDTYIFKGTRK